MNYNWNIELEKGQAPIGFLDIYTSVLGAHNVKILINYYPQLPNGNYERHVHVTLFYDGPEGSITDGFFHWVMDDICELVMKMESIRFPVLSPRLEHIQSELYVVDKIPNLAYFTHGDYGVRHD